MWERKCAYINDLKMPRNHGLFNGYAEFSHIYIYMLSLLALLSLN